MVTKVNDSNQTPSTWEKVTTNRAWRHTVGRISCLARIPIYTLGTLLQAAKTSIKGIVSPLVSLGRWATGSDKLESWSFSGVAKDALMTGHLIDRTMNSAFCVLFAPPKPYYSFWEAVKSTGNIVALGNHQSSKGGSQLVSTVFAKVVYARPQYHKQIIQTDRIYNDKLVPVSDFFFSLDAIKDKIKAG